MITTEISCHWKNLRLHCEKKLWFWESALIGESLLPAAFIPFWLPRRTGAGTQVSGPAVPILTGSLLFFVKSAGV